MNKGKYIVLEGPEGVGKTTQIQELARRLQSAGLPVRTLREPDSQSDLTARTIRHLTQDPRYPMNTNTEVLLYNAARSQSLQVIKQSVELGVNCIVDRNYLTTLAIQYYGRGDISDYETINRIISFAVNGIEPDLTIVLDAPVPTLLERLTKRREGERFDNLDAAFLERVRAGYLWEAKERQLPVIFSTNSQEEVSDEIWRYVAKTLSIRNKQASTPAQSINEILVAEPPLANLDLNSSSSDTNKPSKQSDDEPIHSIQGQEQLEYLVTNTKGDIYAFNSQLPPATIASVLSISSETGNDIRKSLIEACSSPHQPEAKNYTKNRAHSSIPGLQLVIENASSLLSEKLLLNNITSVTKQTLTDQTCINRDHGYYTPPYMGPATTKLYSQTMDKIFEIHDSLADKLTNYTKSTSHMTKSQACEILKPLLPVAATETISIFAPYDSLRALAKHLQYDQLTESKTVGKQILKEINKAVSASSNRPITVKSTGDKTTNRYSVIKDILHDNISHTIPGSEIEISTLTDLWPRNEMDLIAYILYQHSPFPLKTIRDTVGDWSYNLKSKVLNQYIGAGADIVQESDNILDKARYTFDLLTDFNSFIKIQNKNLGNSYICQSLTPRYGFEVPQAIEDAGLTSQFEKCFELSLELHSNMQSAGYDEDAQYAALYGHKMRCSVTFGAQDLYSIYKLTKQKEPTTLKELADSIYDKIAEVHPLIAKSISTPRKRLTVSN